MLSLLGIIIKLTAQEYKDIELEYNTKGDNYIKLISYRKYDNMLKLGYLYFIQLF